MIFLPYLTFCITLVNGLKQINQENLDEEWQNFKKKFDKVYENEIIESYR